MWPHRRHPTASLILVSAVVLLAGCNSPAGNAADAASPGSIDGWVTDAFLQPVAGAAVRVTGIGNATTAEDGSYRLGAEWPARKVLVIVEADGFAAASRVVQPAGPSHQLQLNFTLTRLPSGPWTDTRSYNGFIACGAIVQVGHSHGGGPEDDNHVACPVLAGDADQVFEYVPKRNPDDMVIEVFWQAGTRLAEYITVILYDDQGEILQFEEGDSPLRLEVGQAHVQAKFQDGRTGMIELRAGLREDDPPAEVYYSVHVDQSFDVFASTSHGARFPVGWSVQPDA